MSSKNIILRKIGSFYQVFDDDAYIINYLFSYKINNYKCGFPISAIEKVKNELNNKKINYVIKEEQEIKMDFKKENKYNSYLKKSLENYNINLKIQEVINSLKELEPEKIKKILKSIEEQINNYK